MTDLTSKPPYRYQKFNRSLARIPVLVMIIALSGCASRMWNAPLLQNNATARYDFRHQVTRHNSSSTFVVLVFSGGGTRSAAFSYGVLKALRDSEVTIDGQVGPLLDQIDVISSVSGGSYTAAYYGLFGDRIFEDYERIFLRKNIQKDLLEELLKPANSASLIKSNYNRGDLAARWLGNHLFENKKFSDMSPAGLPFIIINASDINNGMTFSFIQQQFDFLCSDIRSYPVGNAVMASSAVPVIFGPISLRNYDNNCKERRDSWVPFELAVRDPYTRKHQSARALDRYYDPGHMPIVRLLDGGITDNLGVRGSMMSPVAHYGNVEDMAGAFTPEELDQVTNVLVIVANAQIYQDFKWSIEGKDPSVGDTLFASFDAALGLLSTETVSLAKSGFEMWAEGVNSRRAVGAPRVAVTFATLTFEDIQDPAERARFNAIPTALALPDKDVDDLERLADDLVRASPEIQEFIKSSH